MMVQYRRIKDTCGDAILMFRLGDFYEMFEEDAKIASRILDLALTKKHIGGGNTVPLAGIPYHALNNYLFKLTRSGYRVAICEQTEDPSKTKKLVNREIVRTVTPGTLVEAEGIEGFDNNYLAAIHDDGLKGFGFAVVDISTGEFRATAFGSNRKASNLGETDLAAELGKTSPTEILVPPTLTSDAPFLAGFLKRGTCIVTPLSQEAFSPRDEEKTVRHVEGVDLDPGEARLARLAASAILFYLNETQKGRENPTLSLAYYRPAEFLGIDETTERNLELISNLRDGTKRGTLFSVLDRTKTAMGARQLKQWILRPLIDLEEIHRRQDAIAAFIAVPTPASSFSEALREVRDIERLLSRITYRTAGPRDLAALAASLSAIPTLSSFLSAIAPASASASLLFEPLDEVPEVRDLLSRALVDEPPVTTREGGIFTEGYNEELDDLRKVSRGGKDWILKLQTEERHRTGIPSLKIGYNKVFGYYIEITHAHREKVPPEYIRKQTLVAAERYITPDLKEHENKVLSAQDKIFDLERTLFEELLEKVGGQAERITGLARRLADLDALQSLADVAAGCGYCRPTVDLEERIHIEGGRHPTIENSQAIDRFVPNDTHLDCEEEQILLITGPNMGGKSTYIRQVALLVHMAQMGAFIPATEAQIGLVDRVFSRVGASDNLFEGQSTFMVEMSEAAAILRNATPRSLIILDEIGRGTATYDGISLAWSIVEYLRRLGKRGVKTLFATHYHEMAELEERYDRIRNYHALVAEEDGKVTFLYQIAPGRSDHSYGIHVADLAGVPKNVTRRATRILSQLESGDFHKRGASDPTSPIQMSLFSLVDEPIAEQLRKLSVEDLTPVEALSILDDLIKQSRGEG